MKHKIGIGIAAILFASVAFGAVDGFTIKVSPKVGDIQKYAQSAKLDFNGMELDFSAVATRKTTKVDDNGNYSVKEEVSEMKLNGADAPQGSGPGTTTVTLSPKGELVKLEGDQVNENAYRMSNLELFVLPDKAVNPGDTWTYDIKEDKATGAVAGKATYTFVGDEKIGSIDTIKVKCVVKEVGDTGASTDGFLWLKKDDATLVKMTAKWVDVPIAAGANVSGDITVTLIQ